MSKRHNVGAGGNSAFKNYEKQFAHIQDPNERRRLTLAEIDNAPFGWYHVRAIAVAGVGFFADAYDIFAINMACAMLGIVFYPHGKLPATAETTIKIATSVGTIIGQLSFGLLADVLGRRRMYGLGLIIIIITTVAQALASNSPGISITGIIAFWRIMMGIGIGGDYPLSSVITSEFATTKWRGAMMAAVFAMQGLGQFFAALVTLICVEAFKKELTPAVDVGHCDAVCMQAVDRIWRIVIGFGAVPAALALYYRLTIPETPRYTLDIAMDVEKAEQDTAEYLDTATAGYLDNAPAVVGSSQGHEREHSLNIQEADADTAFASVDVKKKIPHPTPSPESNELAVPKASWSDFFATYSQWRYGKVLLGTAGSWFLLDVAFYGIQLNNSLILSQIGYTTQKDVYGSLRSAALGNLILICAGAIPGYWVTVGTIDVIGRKPIQLWGFFILAVLFFAFGFGFLTISITAMMALYILCQFFMNFGPNATTFVLPGEVFPTRYRSTCHGISAASGKLGAVLSQVVVGPMRLRQTSVAGGRAKWVADVMKVFAAFMVAGMVTTWWVPETKRKTLEEVVEELYGDKVEPEAGVEMQSTAQANDPNRE